MLSGVPEVCIDVIATGTPTITVTSGAPLTDDCTLTPDLHPIHARGR